VRDAYRESVRARERFEDGERDRAGLDREPEQPWDCWVMVTATDGAYPVSPNRFFKMIPQVILGTEEVGQPGILTPTPGAVYAFNIGMAVPPLGTRVVVIQTQKRFVFEYNG